MRPFRRSHLRMAASSTMSAAKPVPTSVAGGDEAPRKGSVLDRGGEPRCAKQDCRRQEHAPDHRAATATAAYLDDVWRRRRRRRELPAEPSPPGDVLEESGRGRATDEERGQHGPEPRHEHERRDEPRERRHHLGDGRPSSDRGVGRDPFQVRIGGHEASSGAAAGSSTYQLGVPRLRSMKTRPLHSSQRASMRLSLTDLTAEPAATPPMSQSTAAVS